MERLALTNPYEIARDGSSVILVGQADLGNLRNIETMAQIWQPDEGYSRLDRLQVMLKFLYNTAETTPPIPWVEPLLTP